MIHLSAELQAKRAQLHQELKALGKVAVALSGGVDSSLLLAEARTCLGDNACAAVGVSPSLAQRDLHMARSIAKLVDSPLIEISTQELEIEAYKQNRGDRCYFCKTELYSCMASHSKLQGVILCDGANKDDLESDRPGMKAAKEQEVRSPLRLVGLSKEEVRLLARDHQLPNWDRPASPCLASRVQVGTLVSGSSLAHVEQLEAILHQVGLRIFRVRIQKESVLVELSSDDWKNPQIDSWLADLRAKASEFGYMELSLSLVPYGSKLKDFD